MVCKLSKQNNNSTPYYTLSQIIFFSISILHKNPSLLNILPNKEGSSKLYYKSTQNS